MTNSEIIEQARTELYRQGKLGTTGRMFKATIINADGEQETKLVPEPEEIHTFQHWKTLGFKVKKGEHALIRLTIWKHSSKKRESENGEEVEDGRCFMKESCFFSQSQVEAIA